MGEDKDRGKVVDQRREPECELLFCPRRHMADTSARLVDDVFPGAPLRQWDGFLAPNPKDRDKIVPASEKLLRLGVFF